MRLTTCGVGDNAVDEYLRMGKSSALEYLKQFVVRVVECFGDNFLRPPSESEMKLFLRRGDALRFPSILG